MKTITEYQPLIFSRILHPAERSKRLLRFRGPLLVATILEVAVGFWLMADTGFLPWTWQFWVVFGPVFLAGELAGRALSPRDAAAVPEGQ